VRRGRSGRRTLPAPSTASLPRQHANEEQSHADQIAARIVQLNGEPNFSPEGLLSRSHSENVAGEDLIDMIKEDLVAERVAIDTYREMIGYLGDPIFNGLAISLIFGILVSTALTLVVIPVLYYVAYQRRFEREPVDDARSASALGGARA
jgi:hypothetical protein